MADAVSPAQTHQHGYADQRKALLGRLKRIEGQVRGIARMVENDRYCIDILTQMMAARSGLNQVGLTLLDSHTKHCVAAAAQSGGGDEKFTELMEVVARFVK
ncbi:MAG: metal-sensitive transcriptional regulator [Thermaerobacterales bacterium]